MFFPGLEPNPPSPGGGGQIFKNENFKNFESSDPKLHVHEVTAAGEGGDPDNHVLIYLTADEGNTHIDKALRFHSSFIQYLYRLVSTKSD